MFCSSNWAINWWTTKAWKAGSNLSCGLFVGLLLRSLKLFKINLAEVVKIDLLRLFRFCSPKNQEILSSFELSCPGTSTNKNLQCPQASINIKSINHNLIQLLRIKLLDIDSMPSPSDKVFMIHLLAGTSIYIFYTSLNKIFWVFWRTSCQLSKVIVFQRFSRPSPKI